MVKILIMFIKGYQVTISKVIPGSCRFYPSCSNYAVEALERYGIVRGGWLFVKRLMRCHPWYAGGYDPVPKK